MKKPPQQDNLLSYENRGQMGWYQVAEKRDAIRTENGDAPELVTLQFMRFRNDGTKIHTEIELPLDGKVTLTVNDSPVDYEIASIVLHSGYSMDSGHYFAYLKKEAAWVEANDAIVEKLDKLPDSASSQAYLIFLQKV